VIRAAALLAAACGAAQAETWLYRVALDPAAPLAARVVVELPADRRAQDFSVQVRGLASGVAPQVSDLRCDGVPLAPDSARAWRVQGWNCVHLTWTLTIKAPPDEGIDPRARQSIHDAGRQFWLVSEVSSLLRPVGEARHDGQVEFVGRGPVHGSVPVGNTARRLVPAADRPGEFYVIGRLPGATVREGDFETLHLDADGGDWRGLVGEHGRALQYLVRAAGPRQLAPLSSTVVWLGGPTDDGVPIGVAGHRTLLLSVARRDGRLQHGEIALAWLLREQLAQAMPQRLPLWARESLAQYYAVKALRRSKLPPAAVAAAEKRLIDPQPPRGRLPEAQRRAESGDEGAQAELRATGAAFWERLDRAIVRKSGFRTLDSALPGLLAADWPDDRLPPSLLDQLRRHAGDSAVDELLALYIGD
jgi:hypothetical protein